MPFQIISKMSVTFAICLLLTILTCLVWLFSKLKNHKRNEFYKNIPGPPTVPFLGNALDFLSSEMIIPTFMRYIRVYGSVVKGKIGPFRNTLLVTDYQLTERILSSTKLIEKSDDYKYVMPWLGTGLLTSEGPKWKQHRRILNSAFHFQTLERFINVFQPCGEKLVQNLETEVGNPSVDIYPYVTLCSLDIICESIMGISINVQDHKDSDYVRSVKQMCRIAVERAMSPIEMYDLLYPFSKNYYLQKKALKVLKKQSIDIIQARRKELVSNSLQTNSNLEDASKQKKPFLDLLLHATVDNRPLTDEEIREEVDTFMFAGYDTTATAISFVLFCLATHPQVQERAFEELQTMCDNGQNWTVRYEDLLNMKYLEQVIKETLRLYPSVPTIARRSSEEIKFENKLIPKNESLFIFPYGIHRNPKYFKDPEKFDPERFRNVDGKFPYAYIPFSAGPRNCIGQKFAMLEIKSIIAKILVKFVLRPATPEHEIKLVCEAVLKSKNGIKISLYLRK